MLNIKMQIQNDFRKKEKKNLPKKLFCINLCMGRWRLIEREAYQHN